MASEDLDYRRHAADAAGDTRVPVLLSPCGHIFCEDCACEWLEKERTCPLCRATVDSPLDGGGVSEDILRELSSFTGATSSFPYIF